MHRSIGTAGRALAGITLVATALVRPARAHVEYVTDDPGSSVDVVQFLLSVISTPTNAAILAGGALGLLAAVGGYLRYRPLPRDRAVLVSTLAGYDAYVPWMLRLSIGLPLVGAGFAGYFFSPAVQVEARILQVGLGFLLLFGLATRATAIAGLLAFAYGLAFHPQLVLALEYVGGLAGVALVGSGRPSADHLLKRVADTAGTTYGRIDPVHRLANWFDALVSPYRGTLPLVVRVPLGLNFAFLGLREKLLDPGQGLAVVAKYGLAGIVPVDPGLWVVGAGLVELAVGVALLLGLFTRATAAVAFVTLTLTLFGLPDDPVLAHVSLFGLTSALFVTGGGPFSVDRLLENRAS